MTCTIPNEWDADLWGRGIDKIESGNDPETAEAMTVYRACFYSGEKFGWTCYRMQMFQDASESLEKAIKK